jgi:DNA oxidative demethylase
VARAPSEEPDGIVYRAGVLAPDEEGELLRRFETLRFDPIVLHGRAAKRSGRHYGLDYDYESRTPRPGEPMPDWLATARARAAELAGVNPEELVEILVQDYPAGATIGWHRDAPAFGTVVGVSLLAPSRLRFRRGSGDDARAFELELPPRSGYVLAGEARTKWQHHIPPTNALRYSITFRTLKV